RCRRQWRREARSGARGARLRLRPAHAGAAVGSGAAKLASAPDRRRQPIRHLEERFGPEPLERAAGLAEPPGDLRLIDAERRRGDEANERLVPDEAEVSVGDDTRAVAVLGATLVTLERLDAGADEGHVCLDRPTARPATLQLIDDRPCLDRVAREDVGDAG